MKDVHENREAFGALVKKLRNQAGLSLKGLDRKSGGVTYSLISAIESGDRAVGGIVAEKLADAFGLQGAEREQFLMQAAATRKRDRLMSYARTLDPEILNYVAWRLVKEGVDLTSIKSCELMPSLAGKVNAEQVEEQFKTGLAGYLKALYEITPTQESLVMRMRDGSVLVCGLLFAKSKGAS